MDTMLKVVQSVGASCAKNGYIYSLHAVLEVVEGLYGALSSASAAAAVGLGKSPLRPLSGRGVCSLYFSVFFFSKCSFYFF